MKKLLYCYIVILFAGALWADEGFRYDAKGKRDPFVPLVSEKGSYASDAYAVSSIEDIRLEGIVCDEQKGSIAIINGEILRAGQEIGSMKVLKIEKDSVTFDISGKSITVYLNNE